MTPKKEARELVNKFTKHQSDDYPNSDEDYHAKQCAIICVDEMYNFESNGYDYEDCNPITKARLIELEEVKKEIEKL